MGWKRGPRVEYIGCRQGASLTSYRPRTYNPNDMVTHTDQVLELHSSFGPLLRGKLIPNLKASCDAVLLHALSTSLVAIGDASGNLPLAAGKAFCIHPTLRPIANGRVGAVSLNPRPSQDVPWGLPLSTDHRLLCSTQPSPRVHVHFCHPDR